MADSTLRAWLRTHLGKLELATDAPKGFDLGLVAGTLGALLALPAFADADLRQFSTYYYRGARI